MYPRSRFLISVVIPLMLFYSTAFTQESYLKWQPEDGVAIRQGWHVSIWGKSGKSRIEGELAGEVGFAWTDSRDGVPTIAVQVIDTNGELKFAENGLRLVITQGSVSEPVIHPATDGGWFLVWRDFRSNNGGDLYCTKIDREGHVLWGEDSGGVPVVTNNTANHKYKIVDDDQGGFIIAWQIPLGMASMAIYAMHIQSDGQQDADWARNGLMIFNGNVYLEQWHQIEVDTDNNGGMVLSWFSADPENPQDIWDVYAQRISPQGELMWGGQGGVRVSNNTHRQFRPQVCSDGEGGAFFCWNNDGWGEIRPALYAQRLDRDGNKMWDEDGEIISPTLDSHFGSRCVSIVASGDGDAIVVWSDRREDNRRDDPLTDIYTMKFSGDDALVRLWEPEEGVPICADDTSVFSAPYLCTDSEGGAYYTWTDEREANWPEVDIWAQHIDSDGDISWEENGVPVYVGEYQQFAPEVFQSADGRCIINWTDASISSEGFGCQLITREGEPVWDENGISLVSGMIGDVENPVLFSNMNGEFGIVWLDSRNTTKNPFFQFGMDNEDSVQFTFADNGMSIFNSDSLKMVETVDAVKNIDDGFIITWTESDRESRNNKGYVQRFSAQGESMWNENGIQCSLENQDLNESLICSDNNGGAYVVWSESEEDIIFIQRISSDGEYQFQRDGVHLSADGGRSLPMDIIEDGEGGCVVLWQQTLYDDGGWGVFAQRVNQDGSLIWEEGGLEVNHLDEERPNPRILKHPQGFFFLWQDDRDGEEERFGLDIYCQFVDTEGNILWMEEGELICDYGEDHDDPVMAVDNDGFIWIGWEDHRSEFENGTDLYIQKIYMDIEFPDLEFDSRGYELVAEQYNQHSLQLEHDGQNGLWAVWVEDNLPYGEQGDLYAIHLDPDGRRYEPWDRGGNLICGAPLKQEKPQIARLKENGETGIVVAWIDGRSFDDMTQQNYNLYSQRIDDDFYTDGVKKRNGQTMTPMDFSITGTYPNPFNSTILIGYSLPVQAFVSLNVYNINGQLINTLFEGHQKSGFRNTCFNANNLPSGTYFLRMETSDQMFTRKISLIR